MKNGDDSEALGFGSPGHGAGQGLPLEPFFCSRECAERGGMRDPKPVTRADFEAMAKALPYQKVTCANCGKMIFP